MKEYTYDPDTEKEYAHENVYDYQIQRAAELHQCFKYDDEVIDYAFFFRDELINDLENKDDTIRLKYIKWIDEEYLLKAKDFFITERLPIHERLIGFKSFSYENIDEHVLKEGGNDKKKNLLERVVSKDGEAKGFKITISKDHKKFRFSRDAGRYTDWLSAKDLGIIPKLFDLIIRYGFYQKVLVMDKTADTDWEWFKLIQEDSRTYETIQKYQSDFAKWCQTNLNIIENPFVKMNKLVGEQMMEGVTKVDTYRCHFNIRFDADWTETKQHKRIKGNV